MMTATIAELMARMSASMLHAALANAAEKAQQQQHNGAGNGGGTAGSNNNLFNQSSPFFPFPFIPPPLPAQMPNLPPLLPLAPPLPPSSTMALPVKSTTPEIGANLPSGNGIVSQQPDNKSYRNMEDAVVQQSPDQSKGKTKSGTGGGRKRKRPCASPAAEEEVAPTVAIVAEQPQQQQQLAVPIEQRALHQASNSPLSSRISSPDSSGTAHHGRGARKLKLYATEEKVDIIDYAKCIGNRAAGREFNVAESSIREWRKNEEKIRRQAETTAGCTQHFEQEHPKLIAWVDNKLVGLIEEKAKECMDWYGIGAKARELWKTKVEEEKGGEVKLEDMKITMGWVSRFMRRNEQRVPKIAPPIIATGNNGGTASPALGVGTSGGGGTSSTSAALSMVKSNSILPDSSPPPTVVRETRSKTTSSRAKKQRKRMEEEEEDEGEVKEKKGTSDQKKKPDAEVEVMMVPSLSSSSSSRRKCQRPMRVDAACATLLTTTSANSMPITLSNGQSAGKP